MGCPVHIHRSKGACSLAHSPACSLVHRLAGVRALAVLGFKGVMCLDVIMYIGLHAGVCWAVCVDRDVYSSGLSAGNECTSSALFFFMSPRMPEVPFRMQRA